MSPSLQVLPCHLALLQRPLIVQFNHLSSISAIAQGGGGGVRVYLAARSMGRGSLLQDAQRRLESWHCRLRVLSGVGHVPLQSGVLLIKGRDSELQLLHQGGIIGDELACNTVQRLQKSCRELPVSQ